jgi:3-isopropylmalate/(R)-2-methylmalate dehydratase small subunit
MYNCGMIAAELPGETLDEIFRDFAPPPGPPASPGLSAAARSGEQSGASGRAGGPPVTLSVDTDRCLLVFRSGAGEKTVPFVLEGFERALVEAGGWVEYAAGRY